MPSKRYSWSFIDVSTIFMMKLVFEPGCTRLRGESVATGGALVRGTSARSAPTRSPITMVRATPMSSAVDVSSLAPWVKARAVSLGESRPMAAARVWWRTRWLPGASSPRMRSANRRPGRTRARSARARRASTAAGAWTMAATSHARFERDDLPDDEVRPLQKRTNTATTVAGVAGVSTLALGVTTVLTW